MVNNILQKFHISFRQLFFGIIGLVVVSFVALIFYNILIKKNPLSSTFSLPFLDQTKVARPPVPAFSSVFLVFEKIKKSEFSSFVQLPVEVDPETRGRENPFDPFENWLMEPTSTLENIANNVSGEGPSGISANNPPLGALNVRPTPPDVSQGSK